MNFLPLAIGIEEGFDHRRLAFVPYHPDGNLDSYKLVIYDAALRGEKIFPRSETTIGDYEHREFVFPENRPYTRCLHIQAQEAYIRIYARPGKWLD